MSFLHSIKQSAKSISPWLVGLLRHASGREVFQRGLDFLHLTAGQGAGAGWDFDAEVRVAAQTITRPTPFVIDAGANTGVWTEKILTAHPAARVLAIEPLPDAAALIRKLALPQVTLVEAALAATEGQGTLHFSSPCDVSASLQPRADTSFADRDYSQVPVRLVTLDALIPENEIVDFLKMDLEGHELDALRGAARCLERGQIRALTFEFGSANLNSRTFFRDFWDLLTPAGYRLSRLLPGGALWPITAYHEGLEYFRGATNYLAVREDPR